MRWTPTLVQRILYGRLVMGPYLPSLKGSGRWAPILKVVYDGVIVRVEGFRIRGPHQRTIESTWDCWALLCRSSHLFVSSFSVSQRVQLDCHSGIRSQNVPYIAPEPQFHNGNLTGPCG